MDVRTDVGDAPNRWRNAADAVSAILGLNLWVALLFVPALFAGAIHSVGGLLLLTSPLWALLVGLITRGAVWLLLAYPALLLIPLTFDERIRVNHKSLWVFVLIGASLVAYVLGVSFMNAFEEPPAPDALRGLSRAPGQGILSPRWRRRLRVFRGLFVLSIVFPAVLLYASNFSTENRAFFELVYPDRARAMLTVVNLGVLVLWLGIFLAHFLDPLGRHRTGDRDLVRELDRLGAEATRGSPRLAFYVGVVVALVFMGLLLVLRYR